MLNFELRLLLSFDEKVLEVYLKMFYYVFQYLNCLFLNQYMKNKELILVFNMKKVFENMCSLEKYFIAFI